jgi:hypothetical protein
MYLALIDTFDSQLHILTGQGVGKFLVLGVVDLFDNYIVAGGE